MMKKDNFLSTFDALYRAHLLLTSGVRYTSCSEIHEWIQRTNAAISHSPIGLNFFLGKPSLCLKLWTLRFRTWTLNNAARKSNKSYLQNELKELKDWFDQIESHPLTINQREAIIGNEDNNLIVAGAGTGKTSTIIGKVAHILKRNLATADEILLLAFSKKAQEEMDVRIRKRLKESIDIFTFHSFGSKITAEATKKKPSLSPLAQDENRFQKFILREIAQLLRDPSTKQAVSDYFAFYMRPFKTCFDFKTEAEYVDYLRSPGTITLLGEKVRSTEECRLANWLFLNGIEYEYERPYEFDTASIEYRQYHPDFYLPKSKIYIEHLGLDRKGRTASFVDQESYHEALQWKRDLHEEHQTTLVETFSYEHFEGTFPKSVKEKLGNYDVRPRPISIEAIEAALKERGRTTELSKLIGTFLRHFKAGRHDLAELKKQSGNQEEPQRTNIFLQMFESIFRNYQIELDSRDEIDFEDMINLAADYTNEGKFKSKYKYVIVDEFQDISQDRATLLQAILNQVPNRRLFCVGDDWQAIYGFSGCDVGIMRKFHHYFGKTLTTKLDTTFRFGKKLIACSSNFILKNPSQLKKDLTTTETTSETNIELISLSGQGESSGNQNNREEQDQRLQRSFHEILKDISTTSGRGEKSVLILGRYNFEEPADLEDLSEEFSNLKINFLTVHRSKGLEADYVIILGLRSGTYGFPCEIVDDPILDLVSIAKESFLNAEERRLFYVAMTRARKKLYLVQPPENQSAFCTELANAEYSKWIVTKNGAHSTQSCLQCKSGILKKKQGKFTSFWGCSNHPYCKGLHRNCPKCEKSALRREENKFICISVECDFEGRLCPECKKGMLTKRNGKYGEFLGCSEYRSTGASCPHTENV